MRGEIIKRERDLIDLFEKLMKERNFIVHKEPIIDGFMRPDFIFEKDRKKFAIEIKSVSRIKPRSIYQIISYLLKDRTFDGGYLAIPTYTKISPFVEKKLKESGIGLIRFNDDKFEFILEPKDKSVILNLVISDKSKKILIKHKISKKEENELIASIAEKIAEVFEKSLDKRDIENFPKNIIIFVIIASLIGSSLWSTIQFFINNSNNKILSLIIPLFIFFIFTLILIIYYFYIKDKPLRESANG